MRWRRPAFAREPTHAGIACHSDKRFVFVALETKFAVRGGQSNVTVLVLAPRIDQVTKRHEARLILGTVLATFTVTRNRRLQKL
jgi:hypothetical protein